MDFIQLRLWFFRQASSLLPFRSMPNTYFGITPKVFAIIPKSVFDLDRNRCSICSEMSVRHAPKFALDSSIETERYVERLKDVRVAVTGKREVLSSFNGQHMVLMVTNLLSRCGMNIDIIVPPDIKAIIASPFAIGNSLCSELARMGKEINPFHEIRVIESTTKQYDGVIAIGECSCDIGRTVLINSDGWVSFINTDSNSMPWIGHNCNPVGACVASCIGVAELFKILFARFRSYRYIGSLAFSAFDYGFMHSSFVNPRLPNEVAMDISHFVSMGAINSGVLYTLCAVPGIRGNIVMIEPEKLDISNLNRYAFSFAEDAIKCLSKNEAATKFVGTRLTIEKKFNEPYKDVSGTLGEMNLAVVGVDNVEGRWDVQRNNPRHIICGGTVMDQIRLSMHRLGEQGACLRCLDPETLPRGEEPVPTISFVSILAGALMAGEIIKHNIYDFRPYCLNNVLDLSLLSSSHFTQKHIPQSKDCHFCSDAS